MTGADNFVDADHVIVVVPALDAQGSVGGVVRGVRAALPGCRVIGVDDGSQDDTRRILREVCDLTIEFDVNRGKGAALREAFRVARKLEGAQAILTIDADGQHDVSYAPRLIEGLSGYDLVIGTRKLDAGVPLHRLVANRISNRIVSAFLGRAIRDSQSGYRAFRLLLADIGARGDRYEFEMDFLFKAIRYGATVEEVEIPTLYGPPSRFRPIQDAIRVLGIMFRNRKG